MLLHVPEVLGPDELKAMRAALADAAWIDGRETVGSMGAKVKRNEQLADASPQRLHLGQTVLAALARHALYHAAALPLRTLAPRFNRYAHGGHYGLHIDGAVMALGGEAGQFRSDISCTLFLSAPDEYTGGELVITDTYGEHEVKLPAGDLIIYPSSSLHQVLPVTRGARVAAFFWVQSLVRDDTHRRMLFDLDVAIQKLTQHPASDPEALLSLTGIYHNLLRQWAQT